MLSFHVKFVQTDRRTDGQTEGRTDGQTDNGKTICPLIFRYGSKKKKKKHCRNREKWWSAALFFVFAPKNSFYTASVTNAIIRAIMNSSYANDFDFEKSKVGVGQGGFID